MVRKLRSLTRLIVVMLSLPVYGQYCLDDSQCRSQLLRVEVAANAMGPGNVQQLMPALQSLAGSDLLQNALKRGFDLQPLSFPHSIETCVREKAEGDANFQSIDCNSKTLCSQANLNPVVREQICFKLPCPILEGTLLVGACAAVEDIYPTAISFPGQLEIQKIKLTPTSVNVVGPRARLCFRVDELQLDMSAQLALDTANTQLPDSSIKIDNITPRLDQPHEACVSARVDLTSATPITDIQVENPAGPFISDQMVREASQALQVTGLSGYPTGALQAIQAEVVPALFHPLRASIEDGIKKSLGETFQKELEKVIRPLTAATAGQSLYVNSQGFMSELGLANLEVHNQMARVECAALKGAGRPIPPSHACIGLPEFGDETITPDFDSPVINELMNLQWKMQGRNITSEAIKQRLIALKEVLRQQVDEFPAQPNDPPSVVAMHLEGHQAMIQRYLSDYVDPMIGQISTAQLEGQLYNFIEIQNQLQQGQSANVGMSLPEICSATNPSPHAGREIPNCPIQAYVDLNEFNKVLERMWETGAICQTGRGKFVPRLDSSGQPMMSSEGKPLGSGCYMEMSGMGCYLKSAPQIRFDTATRKYKVPLQLEKCFYPGVQFLFMNTGLGRFGADFNIDFAFRPKACHNGDFCMENPDVDWAVVPGSGSQGLGDDSWLQSIITGEIGKALNGALGNTIRIPLASGAGALANVPLQAEGRVDSGSGFFGACLEVQEEGSP